LRCAAGLEIIALSVRLEGVGSAGGTHSGIPT